MTCNCLKQAVDPLFINLYAHSSKQQLSVWLEKTGSTSNFLGRNGEHINTIIDLSSVCGNMSTNRPWEQ